MKKLQKQFLSPSTPWKNDSFGDLSTLVESSNSIMINWLNFKLTQ